VLSDQPDEGKARTLEAIFQCNADVNVIDSNGWTALHHAAFTGDLSSLELLIKAGANINAVSN
jgi:ankyrin repeat protein